MRIPGDARVLEERRRIAAKLFERDEDAAAIAAIVNVHPQTVRAWRREYDAGGLKALEAKPHPGPPCKLTDPQKQQLLALLAKPPAEYGFDSFLWTTRLLARLIQERFAVAYHHDHVGTILHQLGYSYQKPDKQPRERNQALIDQWRQVTWPQIVQQSQQRNSTLAFVDEAGFSMTPCLKKTWAPRGQTPIVKHRNRWFRKVSVIGALCITPGRRRLGTYLDWHPGEHIDQSKVVAFLQHLTRQCPGPVDLIWDNLSSHGGPQIRQFLKDHPQLRVHRLPPYAPELNPIEMLWSMSKYHRMANHEIFELEALQQRAQKEVAAISAEQSLLRACVFHSGLADALWPPRDQ